jgi:hypothetical protein
MYMYMYLWACLRPWLVSCRMFIAYRLDSPCQRHHAFSCILLTNVDPTCTCTLYICHMYRYRYRYEYMWCTCMCKVLLCNKLNSGLYIDYTLYVVGSNYSVPALIDSLRAWTHTLDTWAQLWLTLADTECILPYMYMYMYMYHTCTYTHIIHSPSTPSHTL